MRETKFKQTEVGMIPSDWEVKSLGELYTFKYGNGNTNPNNNGPYPIYGANGIIGGYTKYNSENSVVIGHMGEYAGSVIWAEGRHFVTYNGTIAQIKNAGNIDPKYGFYALLKRNINRICAGSGYPFLAYDKLNSIKITIPPIEEQKRIAQALSDVDAVISTTEKLIAKKKALKQGAMQTLLSGKMRIQNGKWTKTTHFKQTELGPIPQEWEVKTFKSVATLVNGRAYAQSELLERGKYKVLRVGNFGTNDAWYYSNLELPEKMYCRKGDLLYCWSCTYGAYIWNGEKTIYHYHIWKIIDLKVDKKFLQYILNSDVDAQMNCSNGSTMSHITKGFLENRLFIFPVQIEEQTAIATVLSDMDSEIAALETKLAKYRQLKTGMMQQLLTGKIRLI